MNYYDLHRNSITDLENMLREGLVITKAYRNMLKAMPKNSLEYKQTWIFIQNAHEFNRKVGEILSFKIEIALFELRIERL